MRLIRAHLFVLLFLIAGSALSAQDIRLEGPKARVVTVSDQMLLSIWQQTTQQTGQLSGINARIESIDGSIKRVEGEVGRANSEIGELRRDVDRQGVLANIFTFGLQTVVTVIITVTLGFLIQYWFKKKLPSVTQ